MDIDPEGETMVTLDRYGLCLVSDVNTNSYKFHVNMKITRKRFSNFDKFHASKTLFTLICKFRGIFANGAPVLVILLFSSSLIRYTLLFSMSKRKLAYGKIPFNSNPKVIIAVSALL